MPQVSVRPASAPQQPPAASLSEPPSCPPAVPAATGQLSRSRMRPPAVAARTVCGLGGWCVRRGPRGPQLPPRAARRKVRGSRDSSNPAPNEPSRAAHSRAFRTSQVPLRGSRRPPAARARRPTSAASPPPPSARPPTSPRGARSSRARCAHCDRARPRAPGAVTAPRRSRRHATQSPRLRRPRLTQSCSARSRRCRCRRAAAIARRHLRPRESGAGRACVVRPLSRKMREKVRRYFIN